MPEQDRITLSIYVTRNRRSPVLGLYGQWPGSSGFAKVARAGVRIGSRYATQEEHEQEAESPRYLALHWDNVRQMLWDERAYIGEEWYRKLWAGLKEKRRQVIDCARDVEKKKRAHARKLAKRRGGS